MRFSSFVCEVYTALYYYNLIFRLESTLRNLDIGAVDGTQAAPPPVEAAPKAVPTSLKRRSTANLNSTSASKPLRVLSVRPGIYRSIRYIYLYLSTAQVYITLLYLSRYNYIVPVSCPGIYNIVISCCVYMTYFHIRCKHHCCYAVMLIFIAIFTCLPSCINLSNIDHCCISLSCHTNFLNMLDIK